MALNSRQQAFVREYLIDLNATQAAIRAGYSSDTAQEQSSRLLSNVMVQEAVTAGKAAAAAAAGVRAEIVLRELARLGLSDVRRLFDGERLMAPHEWSDDAAAVVASIEVDSRVDRSCETDDPARFYTVTKVKLWDKNSALEKLCKHLGLFDRDNAQSKPRVTVLIGQNDLDA